MLPPDEFCLSEEEAELEMDGDSVVLTTHVADRVRWANAVFEKSFPPEARARIPPTTDAGDSPELEVWVSDTRFHELTQCAVGARVTITVNQAPRSGAVNGADATVCALRSKADSGVYAIDVDIDGFGVYTLYKHHARSRVNAGGGTSRRSRRGWRTHAPATAPSAPRCPAACTCTCARRSRWASSTRSPFEPSQASSPTSRFAAGPRCSAPIAGPVRWS